MSQVLVFNIGPDEFAVPVRSAVEVIRKRPTRRVPDMPEYIEGFINVRKDIIPLVDMRKRFNVQSTNPKERILVVRYLMERVGLLVDAVSGIVKYNEAELKMPPTVLKGLKAKYLSGVLEHDGNSLIFLDISKILSSREKIALKQAKEKIKKDKLNEKSQ
jgi:purine-binding chemotaxis protein CheW